MERDRIYLECDEPRCVEAVGHWQQGGTLTEPAERWARDQQHPGSIHHANPSDSLVW